MIDSSTCGQMLSEIMLEPVTGLVRRCVTHSLAVPVIGTALVHVFVEPAAAVTQA
jgi:hypothetical protein